MTNVSNALVYLKPVQKKPPSGNQAGALYSVFCFLLWKYTQLSIAGTYFVDGNYIGGCAHIRNLRILLPYFHDLAGGGDHGFFQTTAYQVNFLRAMQNELFLL